MFWQKFIKQKEENNIKKIEDMLPKENNLLQKISFDNIPISTIKSNTSQTNSVEDNSASVTSNENALNEITDVNTENLEIMDEKQITLLEKIALAVENFGKKPEANVELEEIKASLESEKAEKQVLVDELASVKVLKEELEAKLLAKESEEANKAEELIVAQYTAKAVDYIGLSGTPEEIGSKLRKIEAIEDEELRNELLENLKKEAEANTDLTKELGTSSGDAIEDEMAKKEKELRVKAEEMSKKDGITVEQALYRLNK